MDINLRNTAFCILIIIFCMYFLSILGFSFHFSINIFYPVCSVILGLLTLFLITDKHKNYTQNIFICLLLLIVVTVISILFGSSIIDASWDGRTYHQGAIVLLRNGWNPVYNDLNQFANNLYNNTFLHHLLWIENYPKFVETVQANLYTIFKNIETAKMTNVLMAFVLFGYSYYVFSKNFFKKINKYLKILISVIIVANPVNIAQFMTFYIDGYVYLFFMLILLSIIDIETTPENDYISFSFLILSSISIANIKLGGVLCLFVTLIVYSIYSFFKKKEDALKKLLYSIFLILLCLTLTGINPYFTNIQKHRHPLYPLTGEDKVDVVDFLTPKQFMEECYLKNLLVSDFSRVTSFETNLDGKISLKIPFTINEKELIALQDPNIRLSGFGVFWGGILLLSFILAFFIRYRNKEEKDLFCLIFSILIILLLANPYCWWARYTPHQWCLPIFICVAALIAKNNRLEKSFSVLILILMLANVFIQIPRIFIYENRYHSFIDNQMQMLKQLDEKIKIYSVYEYSFIEKLKLNNIKFEFVNEEYYRQNEKDFTGIPFSLTEDMRWNIKEKN